MDAQVDDDGEVAVVNPVRMARDRFMAAVGQAAGGAAFVVQVGANDGRMADPVYSIAKRDGWRGLLIEPHPAYFAKLHKRYKRRDGFVLLQIGISDAEGVLPLHHLDNARMDVFPRWVHGSASVDAKRVVRQVNPSGPHHLGSDSAFIQAPQTIGTGALIRRWITIVRSATPLKLAIPASKPCR